MIAVDSILDLDQTPKDAYQGLTPDQIVEECKKAGNYYNYCIYGIGRDIAWRVRAGEGEQVMKFCEKRVLEDKTDTCIAGVIQVLVGFSWSGKYAYPFCKRFNYQGMRSSCYNLSQWAMLDMGYKEDSEVVKDCKKYVANDPKCISALEDVKDGEEVDFTK